MIRDVAPRASWLPVRYVMRSVDGAQVALDGWIAAEFIRPPMAVLPSIGPGRGAGRFGATLSLPPDDIDPALFRQFRNAAGRPRGLVVTATEPDGAAARAGLQVGDLVLNAGEDWLGLPLPWERAHWPVGTTVWLRVWRPGLRAIPIGGTKEVGTVLALAVTLQPSPR